MQATFLRSCREQEAETQVCLSPHCDVCVIKTGVIILVLHTREQRLREASVPRDLSQEELGLGFEPRVLLSLQGQG